MIEMAYLLRCPPHVIAQLGDRELATLIDVVKDANG
jgi:hypothetical protein